jgi:tryptophan halogenase
MKNIVVLGGGTAGWFTALYMRKYFPNAVIKLIQSGEKGTIGVGEGTTPSIINSLMTLGIDPLEVLKKTKGTIKNGILFENWNYIGHKYYHNFDDNVLNFQIENVFDFGCFDFYFKNIINEKLNPKEYVYTHKLCENKKIDLQNTRYALHFDANLLSEFLQDIGKKRNIEIIDGNYKTVELNEGGFISAIHLEDGRKFNLDFIFDCSGFHRVLIGKEFKEEWISYSKHLPMKKGIPFWLENEDEIAPYTSSIAMKYGWIWKIPLQHRIGSGYIFDSDYIDENQALDEAEQYFGKKLEIRKVIPFEAGRYKNSWVKNCIAVGLSSSFIEPLEATSIFLSTGQLELLRHFLNEMETPSLSSIKLYNEIVENNMDDTLNFVYLHYITKKDNSEFWKNFKNNYPPPKKMQSMLDLIKDGNLRFFDINNTKTTSGFGLYSYLQVCYGLDMFETINHKNYENIVPNTNEYKKITNELCNTAVSHKLFLNNL